MIMMMKYTKINTNKTVNLKSKFTFYIHCVPKKADHQTHGSNSRFSKFFHCTGWFSSKFAVKCLLKIPSHLKRVATLPCEICVQEIAMLKNCMNKLPCKIPLQKIAVKNTRLMMWVLRTRIYIYEATHRITDCTQLPQQRKSIHSRILSHIIIIWWC